MRSDDYKSREQLTQELATVRSQLAAEKQRARMILESVPDAFMGLDREAQITYVNQTGVRLSGIQREQLIGRCVWDLFPHAATTKFKSEYHLAVETQKPVHFEEFYPEPLNLWLECHGYPYLEGVTVFFCDITEQKRAEQEREQLITQLALEKQALAESEQRYRIMGEILHFGIWLTDAQGKAVYTSQSFLTLLDMNMEQMQGFGWTDKLVPEDVEPMMNKWMHCVRTGEDWDYEHRIIDRNGTMNTIRKRQFNTTSRAEAIHDGPIDMLRKECAVLIRRLDQG